MKSKAVIVFVKAPIAGRVKTRLIPLLGAVDAAQFYRCMAMDTLSVLQGLSDTELYVAWDGPIDSAEPFWGSRSPSFLQRFPQVGEGLGERLNHAFSNVFGKQHHKVIAIGSDLPSLSAPLIRDAFSSLESAAVVIGPSFDGGYYLIGLTRPVPGLFQNIAWSTPKVLEQTKATLARIGLPLRLLSTYRDVDTSDDFQSLVSGEIALAKEFVFTSQFLHAQKTAL